MVLWGGGEAKPHMRNMDFYSHQVRIPCTSTFLKQQLRAARIRKVKALLGTLPHDAGVVKAKDLLSTCLIMYVQVPDAVTYLHSVSYLTLM